MNVSRLPVLLSLMIGITQGLVPFRFLNPIPSRRTRALLSNLTIDCTTNDPNVTTKLYVRYQTGLPWKQVVAKDNKVLKRGQVYIILKFALSDIGQYQCHAINAIGDVIISTGMVYGYKPNIPKVRLRPHKQQVVKIGSSAMVACISESYVKLKWFKVVNRRYRAVPRYKLTRRRTHNEFRLELRLANIIHRDEGTYMCRMKYKDRVQELFIDLKINKLRFLAKPKAFTTQWLSSNLTINCTTNDPNARTAVYHRSYPTQRNSGWRRLSLLPGRFVQEGHVYTVVGVTVQDMGQYQCRAWSKEGVLIRWPRSRGKVITVPKIYLNMTISPKISGPFKPYSNHTITCSTKLLSARLQWFKMVAPSKTYTEIPRQRLIKIKNKNENKLILKLSLISQADAGVYKCIMKYHGKRRTLLTALDVGYKPRARSRKAIVIQRVGSRLSLPCKITGLPLPTVTWTKDGRSIGCLHDNSSCNLNKHYVIRSKRRKDQSIRSILRVKGKVVKRDQGLYRCVAMNKYGVHRSVTRVIIVTT